MPSDSKMMMKRGSYPFRLRDPVDGRVVHARFLARIKDITDCCAAWEIVAPARPESKHQ